MPLLATGNQAADTKLVIPALIQTSLDFLKYSRHLSKVYFVVMSDKKADEFNNEMNKTLGREKIRSSKGDIAVFLRNDLISNVDTLIRIHGDNSTFADFKRVIISDFRPFEFCAISRKVIEYIIAKINPQNHKVNDLYRNIESLSNFGVSQWMINYFHIIRVFGNEAVHHRELKVKYPKFVDEKDLEIGMYCMIKILDLYKGYDK